MKYTFYLIIGIMCVLGILYFFTLLQNGVKEMVDDDSDLATSTEDVDIINNEKTTSDLGLVLSSEWFTSSDTSSSFSYPDLSWKYIEATKWPPKLQILDEPYFCTPSGALSKRAGKTEVRVIDGNTYCVTKIQEGAAGSVYHQYVYAFTKESKAAIFTFTLRFRWCNNYDKEDEELCRYEQQSINPDLLIDSIVRTLVLK